MEQSIIYIKDLLVLFLAALIGGGVIRFFKLPSIVGYVTSGIILAWFIPSILFQSTEIQAMGMIIVGILLFKIGFEFSYHKLREYGEVIIIGSLIQILLVMFIGVILFPYLGLNFYSALFLSSVLSISSTSITLDFLKSKGQITTIFGNIISGWLYLQDIYVLPLLVLLIGIYQMIEMSDSGLETVFILVRSIFLAIIPLLIILIISRKLFPYIADKIAKNIGTELSLILVISIFLIAGLFFQQFNLSFALGAFLAGLLISQSMLKKGIFPQIKPLSDISLILFIVISGFLFKLGFLIDHFLVVISIIIIITLSKFVITSLLVLLFGYHPKIAIYTGLSNTSVSEFALILSFQAFTVNIITDEINMIVLTVFLISLYVSSLLLQYREQLYLAFDKVIKNYPQLANEIHKLQTVSVSKQERIENHVIILGDVLIEKYLCRALLSVNIPYIVISNDHYQVRILRDEGVNVIYGDPQEGDVLLNAGINKARVLVLADADPLLQEVIVTNSFVFNPRINIVALADSRDNAKRLRSLGAKIVISSEYETLISVTRALFKILKLDQNIINKGIREIKYDAKEKEFKA